MEDFKKISSDEKESKIRCNNCMSEYMEDDLLLLKDKAGFFKGCPKCKTDKYLMDDFIPCMNRGRKSIMEESTYFPAKVEGQILTLACNFLGWQGGTIHQVIKEFCTYPEKQKLFEDIIKMAVERLKGGK